MGGLSPTADDSKAAKQKDPVEEEMHGGSQEPSVGLLFYSFTGQSRKDVDISEQFRTQIPLNSTTLFDRLILHVPSASLGHYPEDRVLMCLR